MIRRPPFHRALLALVAAWLIAPAYGQDAYPAKPITLVVPFPPGGVADIVARPAADALSRYLRQPVVIENKPGAGGGIGMGLVAKAKPDGYTLLLALSISILPESDKITGRAPLYALISSRRSPGSPPIRRCSRCAPTVRGRRCRISSPTPSAAPERSPTALRATTAPCTCRWKCSLAAPGSSCCTCPILAAARR